MSASNSHIKRVLRGMHNDPVKSTMKSFQEPVKGFKDRQREAQDVANPSTVGIRAVEPSTTGIQSGQPYSPRTHNMASAVHSARSPSKNGGWLAWMKKMGDSAMVADGGGASDPGNSVTQDTQKAIAQADENRQKLIADHKREMQQQRDTFDASAYFMRAAAMFQQSVNSFAHVIDDQQMNAILAGESGAAGGMGGHQSAPTASGGGSTFVEGDGSGGIFTKDSRGARNNNPGNIKYSGLAKQWGATGQDDKGFAIFPDVATGYAAMGHQLRDSKLYMAGGNNTIAGIVKTYAPPNDHNDTAGYITTVANQTGIDANAKLTPDQVAKVQAAMAMHETNFVAGGMSGLGHYVPTGGAYSPTTAGFDADRFKAAAGMVAGAIGVSEAGILSGAYSKGDVNIGYQKAIANAKQQFATADAKAHAGGFANEGQRQAAATNLQSAARQLAMLEQYGGAVLGRAGPGGQTSLTQGMTVNLGTNISVNVAKANGFDEAEFERRWHKVAGEALQSVLQDMTDSEAG